MKKVMKVVVLGTAAAVMGACTSAPKSGERYPSGFQVLKPSGESLVHKANYAIAGARKGQVIQFRKVAKDMGGKAQDVVLIEECAQYAILPECNPVRTIEMPAASFKNRLKLALRIGTYEMIPTPSGAVASSDAVKGQDPELVLRTQENLDHIKEMRVKVNQIEEFQKAYGAANVNQRDLDDLKVQISALDKEVVTNTKYLEAAKAFNAFVDKIVNSMFDEKKTEILVNGKDNERIEWSILNAMMEQPTLITKFVPINAGSYEIVKMAPVPQNASSEFRPKPPVITEVTVSQGFEIGATEVTQYDFVRLMGYNPSANKDAKSCPDFETIFEIPTCQLNPVESLDKKMVDDFLQRLNDADPYYTYSVPTEAQWELAARAGSSEAFTFGKKDRETAEAFGWSVENASTTAPVGTKAKNAFGLFDVHGNVAEWVRASFGEGGSSGKRKKKQSSDGKFIEVDPCTGCGSHDNLTLTRGGSFQSKSDECRLDVATPSHPGPTVGLRLVRTRRLK